MRRVGIASFGATVNVSVIYNLLCSVRSHNRVGNNSAGDATNGSNRDILHMIVLFFYDVMVKRLSLIIVLFIGKLMVLLFRHTIDILEFSLPVPILVEQVIVALQLLGDLPHQMKVELGLVSGDAHV